MKNGPSKKSWTILSLRNKPKEPWCYTATILRFSNWLNHEFPEICSSTVYYLHFEVQTKKLSNILIRKWDEHNENTRWKKLQDVLKSLDNIRTMKIIPYMRTCTVNTGSLSRWRSQVRLFLRDGKHVLNAKWG